MATLTMLVELAYGDVVRGHAAIDAALARAGRSDAPQSAADVMSFVRAHLLDILMEEIGPRLTMALSDDLYEKLGSPRASAPAMPPVSTRRPVSRERDATASREKACVALIDADRVGRAALARALIRAGYEVVVVDSVVDLESQLASGQSIDAAVLDADHLLARPVADALSRARPDAVVVARGDPAGAREAVGAALRVDVRSRDATHVELVEALRRSLARDRY
jgi:hypothetical protein